MILHTTRSAINSPSFKKKLSNDEMMNFSIDIEKQRSDNNLALRRQTKSWSLPLKKKLHYDLKQPRMDYLSFLAIIESNDSKRIIQLSNEITKCCNVSKEYFSDVISSLEAIEGFTNTFVSETSPEVMNSMMMALSSMFPLMSSKIMNTVVDCGISGKLYEQFNPITETLLTSINLIIIVSQFSSYGRNSFLTMGIHELLIQTAMETDDLNVAIGCCEALQSIFENPEKVDCDYIESYVSDIVKLLSIQNQAAQNAILRALCAIANQRPSAVNYFIDEGAHILVLRLLQSPELQSSSLCFVSKLCYTNESLKIQEMVDNGLVEILFELILTDHTALVLHVLSRICEKIPDIIFPILPSDFIEQLVEICNSSPFAIMKEGTLLLAILISHGSQEDIINHFIYPEIIEILVNMLSSSQDEIILSCLNAINRIIKIAESTSNLETLLPILSETDLYPTLSTLEESVKSISSIGIKTTKLLEQLNTFDNL